jgi:hypothetical protein
MTPATRSRFDCCRARLTATHLVAGSARREEAEAFIRKVFFRHYGAQVSTFAPNLMLLEQDRRIVAAAGWRSAAASPLFLERYLDLPVERAMAHLAERPVQRERIVEVGNLATQKNGSSIPVILALAEHLDRLGHEWVVFTATSELVGIFSKLGLPLLALGPAEPTRLGAAAKQWGSYYDTRPVVVAGRIRLALDRIK